MPTLENEVFGIYAPVALAVISRGGKVVADVGRGMVVGKAYPVAYHEVHTLPTVLVGGAVRHIGFGAREAHGVLVA